MIRKTFTRILYGTLTWVTSTILTMTIWIIASHFSSPLCLLVDRVQSLDPYCTVLSHDGHDQYTV